MDFEDEVCSVDGCPARAELGALMCAIHRVAKVAAECPVGTKCTRCKRPVKPGDWVTRRSRIGSMQHAICPPAAPRKRADDEAVLPGLFLEWGG